MEMTNKQAIAEFKKINAITRKLSRNGYSVNLIESVLVLTDSHQQERQQEKLNSMNHRDSKEWGLTDENLYTITFD